VDIWNFDETGFQVGNLKGDAVLVPREIKEALIRDPHNRELLASVECVSAVGSSAVLYNREGSQSSGASGTYGTCGCLLDNPLSSAY
jgi:hypothetical protein